MHILHTIAEFRAARTRYSELGFVPTMGYLHAGHLALVARAKRECGQVAVSIFVNPTQFGPNEDLANYPRDLERDLAALQSVNCDLVWIPDVSEMYPAGFSTSVEVSGVTEVLEGLRRPGHFRGVATVVTKLFNVVQPTRAYFGQKDAQQTIVLQHMVRDLAIPVELIIASTVREADGLALSSRNSYLDPTQRQAALVLSRSLRQAEAQWQQGERSVEQLRQTVLNVLEAEPLATTEYVSIADLTTLQELSGDIQTGALISMAVRIGRTRLIDNIRLEPA